MIRKILNAMTIDKYQHFVLAALTALALRWVMLIFAPLWLAMLVSFLFVALCCAGKELIYDKLMGKGCVEWADFFAGLAGALVGVL